MNEPRYRIGIIREKVFNWVDNKGSWFTDYEASADTKSEMAKAIEQDLNKFRIYEVKPNKDISEGERGAIIRAALLELAESMKPN